MSDIFVACMGGSGARVAHSLLNLMTVGIFDDFTNIHVLIVDPDEEHKEVKKAKESYVQYDQLQRVLNPNHQKDMLFKPMVHFYEWNMQSEVAFGEGKETGANLEKLCYINRIGKPDCDVESEKMAKELLNSLFPENERKHIIEGHGYNARPAIGSVFCTASILLDENNGTSGYVNFCNKLKDNLNGAGDTRLMLIGSLFGGTGASCLSALVKDFRRLESTVRQNAGKLVIGGLFMLPYFDYAETVGVDPNGPRKERFNQSAKLALDYYAEKSVGVNEFFTLKYLLGYSSAVTRGEYKNDHHQENFAHFVELEAAMSLLHFVACGERGQTFVRGVKQYTVNNIPFCSLEWTTLYKGIELKKRLGWFLILSIYYTGCLYQQIFESDGKRAETALRFLHNSTLKFGETITLERFRNFCIEYMEWCVEISESVSQEDQFRRLFDVPALKVHIEAMRSGNYKFDQNYKKRIEETCTNIVKAGDKIAFKKFINDLNDINSLTLGDYSGFLQAINSVVRKRVPLKS